MSTTIKINSTNYAGKVANIVFYPHDGSPSINLGNNVLPYEYEFANNYYYGEYRLTFSSPKTYVCTLTAFPPPPSSIVNSVTSTTLAGMLSTDGEFDAKGTNATFSKLMGGLAINPIDHSLYLGERSSTSHKIRKIDMAGNVTTFISTPSTGLSALLPYSLSFDSAGMLYVSTWVASVVKIDLSGTLTQFAGSSYNYGYADANGTAARFGGIISVSNNLNDIVFIGDVHNNVIRTVDPAGNVNLFAGSPNTAGNVNNTVLTSQFSTPLGMVFDKHNNIYVTDGSCIKKITTTGTVFTLAGNQTTSGFADGLGLAARFGNNYLSLAVDDNDNIYVSDWQNNAVRMITPIGEVKTIAGAGPTNGGFQDGVGASNIRFNGPTSICYYQNALYVSDSLNNLIRKLDLS